MYFFLLSYPIIGAGIKYIDDAFDEKTFSKMLAFIITPLLSILGVYTMLIDPASATILLAVLCGVFLKGKIDNIAFIAGFIIILALMIIGQVEFMIFPLIFLGAAAVLDEIGNDLIDAKRDKLKNNLLNKFAIYFFGQRWIMKVSILFLVFLSILPYYLFFAMILFDYAYLSVDAYSHIKANVTSATTMKKVVSTVGYIFK